MAVLQTFGCETCRAVRVSSRRRPTRLGIITTQKLQRHRRAKRETVGAIDLAHAAAAEQADDAVARRDQGARCERAMIDVPARGM